MNLALICVAAGHGRRFGSDKLSQTIGSRTVLARSLGTLRTAFGQAPMVVVLAPDRIEHWREELKEEFPNAQLVPGGARRQDSVQVGFAHAEQLGAKRVAIHDAARALVHEDDIRKVVEALDDCDGAVLCQVVSDTVKRVDARDHVVETVERGSLRLASTPQVFTVRALREAWERGDSRAEWTDEAALLEATGHTVRCVVGDHPNPKLTTRADLEIMRALVGGAE